MRAVSPTTSGGGLLGPGVFVMDYELGIFPQKAVVSV